MSYLDAPPRYSHARRNTPGGSRSSPARRNKRSSRPPSPSFFHKFLQYGLPPAAATAAAPLLLLLLLGRLLSSPLFPNTHPRSHLLFFDSPASAGLPRRLSTRSAPATRMGSRGGGSGGRPREGNATPGCAETRAAALLAWRRRTRLPVPVHARPGTRTHTHTHPRSHSHTRPEQAHAHNVGPAARGSGGDHHGSTLLQSLGFRIQLPGSAAFLHPSRGGKGGKKGKVCKGFSLCLSLSLFSPFSFSLSRARGLASKG